MFDQTILDDKTNGGIIVLPTNYPFILVSLVQLTKYSQPAGASLDMCHSLMRINWPIILIVQSN